VGYKAEVRDGDLRGFVTLSFFRGISVFRYLTGLGLAHVFRQMNADTSTKKCKPWEEIRRWGAG
jgi:hypothetical protein